MNLPDLWLLSDRRTDDTIEKAIADLPQSSAFVFRHYHLDAHSRQDRFQTLAKIARDHGHLVVLSDTPEMADAWGAASLYGPPGRIGTRPDLIRIATVHNADEMEDANRIKADAVMLSPVFPTQSHTTNALLGRDRFLALASLAVMPVIALGGMTHERSKELGWPRWAAIDGLASPQHS